MSKRVKITDLIDFNPTRNLKRGNNAPFVEMAALPESSRDIAYVSKREFKGGGAKFQNGDTLFARITPCLENGKTAKVNILPDGVIGHGSTEFIVMAAKLPDIDEDYVYYLAWLPAFREFAQNRMEGTSGRQRVSWQALSEYETEVPSPETRKAAGRFLRTLDDKIQLNHQINQTLEQIAQAIFKSWFVDFEPVKAKIAALEAGGSEDDALLAAMQVISGHTLWDADAPIADAAEQLTRLQAEQPEHYATLRATAELFPSAMQVSELGEIPEGWKTGPLSDLFELHRGYDLPKKIREDGQFLVYAAGGLHGTHSQYKMEPPGIITGRSGVIGNVYLSLKKYWPLNTTLYVRQFRESGPYYAYHLLGALDLKSLNSGSAVPSLNRNFVHSTIVLKPDSLVLDKFELFASSFFTTMAGNLSQNELLQDVRDTLLPKLLSGELSVADAETQLAEAEEAAHV